MPLGEGFWIPNQKRGDFYFFDGVAVRRLPGPSAAGTYAVTYAGGIPTAWVDVSTVTITQGKTIKRVAGVASSNGDNTLIASVSSKLIKVFAYALQSTGTVNAKIIDGSGGTQLSALWNFQAREGAVVSGPAPPSFLFKGSATTALVLNLSLAVSVEYEVSYWDDDAT